MSRVKEWKFYALLCQNIKEELKRKGLRYREVAPALGMSLSHFCNKITGHGTFSVFEVCKHKVEAIFCSSSGKRCYTKKEAQGVINWFHRQKWHVRKKIPKRCYFCRECGYWHLTSQGDKFNKKSIYN